MEILTIIILICVAIMLIMLIIVLRGMERLKRQNDIIYQTELRKNRNSITKELIQKARERKTILINIKDLPMSARLFRCLNAAEIEYLSQVTQYTRKEILKFRNFGKKSMFELEKLMDKYNLKFK